MTLLRCSLGLEEKSFWSFLLATQMVILCLKRTTGPSAFGVLFALSVVLSTHWGRRTFTTECINLLSERKQLWE